MKKSIFYSIGLVFFIGCIKPQCPNPEGSSTASTKIAVLQPGSEGIDAAVISSNPTLNQPNREFIMAMGWTFSSTDIIYRSYLNFDLSSIPSGAKIQSAKLSLFADTSSTLFPGTQPGQNSLTGSNACFLKRVTSPWDENTITWTNQPSFDDVNKITLDQSVSFSQNYVVDVTQMVKDQISNPVLYYGFVLQLVNEDPYKRMVFYSSDGPYEQFHPKLQINYIK